MEKKNEPIGRWVDIETLKPWRRNPRLNDKAVADVAESIRRFGFASPILAREEDSRIIAGHTRFKAAQELGLQRVPVRFLNLSENDAALLALADNKLAELADWDDQKLEELLQELADDEVDIAGIGWSDDELGSILQTIEKELSDVDPDLAPDELPENPTTELGDVWKLGDHRLLCADSLSDSTRGWLLGKKLQAAVTDPPFAIYGSSTGLSADITDDKVVRPFFLEVMRTLAAVLPWFGTAHIFCDWRSWSSWWEVTKATPLTPKNLLVWDKGDGGMGPNYQNNHELIGYYCKVKTEKTMSKHTKAGIRQVQGVGNIRRHSRVLGHDRLHNAAKPVELLEELLEHVTEPGEGVLDLFGGSGSTLIAAERTGRTCVMVEIEPKWCDVIVERWERLTDQKAERQKPAE